MTDYIDLDLEADPTVLRQNARDWITSQAPDGYIVDPWTDWILGAVARMAVEVVVLTSRVPLVVFREFGQRVLQIPALDATSATGVVTVTAVNTDGFLPDGSPYTLPAGADFDIDGQQFQSVVPVTVVSGQTTATVPVIAVTAGLAGSGPHRRRRRSSARRCCGCSRSPSSPRPSAGRTARRTRSTSTGSRDEIPTLSPKAILLDDFATLARRDLEVTRALAVKGYMPATGSGCGHHPRRVSPPVARRPASRAPSRSGSTARTA